MFSTIVITLLYRERKHRYHTQLLPSTELCWNILIYRKLYKIRRGFGSVIWKLVPLAPLQKYFWNVKTKAKSQLKLLHKTSQCKSPLLQGQHNRGSRGSTFASAKIQWEQEQNPIDQTHLLEILLKLA